MSTIKKFLFNNTNTKQTAAKNAVWLSISRVGSKILRAVIVIFAARELGTSGYGVFSYIINLAAFFTIFSDLGISQILTREVSQKTEERESYFATSLWMHMGLVILTALIVIFLVPYISKIEAANSLLPIAAILIMFDGIRNLISSFFRGLEEMEKETLLDLTANFMITILGVVILLMWASPQNLAIVYAVGAGIGTLLGVFLLRDKFLKAFKNFKKNLVKPILKSAWPVALIGTFGAFMLNIDIILLGYFLSSSDVGLYSAAQKIIQTLYILPTILAATLFPIFSKMAEKPGKLKTLVEKGVASSYLIALPLAIGGGLLSGEIISLVFGSQYAGSIIVFQLLIFTTIMVFPGMILTNYLLAQDKHRKLAPVVVSSLIINVVLDIALIPTLGIVGCAIATIIVSLIYNGLAWRLAKKANNFYTLRNLQKIFFGVAIMALGVIGAKFLEIHVLINILIACIVYFGTLHILKEETLYEIKKALPI